MAQIGWAAAQLSLPTLNVRRNVSLRRFLHEGEDVPIRVCEECHS
jgi:hypothetical protein